MPKEIECEIPIEVMKEIIAIEVMKEIIAIEVMKEIIASELSTDFGSKARIRAKIKRWKDREKLKKRAGKCRSE